MDARRLARSVFLLLWVTLIGAHPLAGAPDLAASESFGNQQSLISAPRQSLPLPVHDEATCAFCQAAAFAPHNPGNAAAPVLVLGPELREILSETHQVISAGSARPPRSRSPPTSPNV
jgi:hypothetical protein